MAYEFSAEDVTTWLRRKQLDFDAENFLRQRNLPDPTPQVEALRPSGCDGTSASAIILPSLSGGNVDMKRYLYASCVSFGALAACWLAGSAAARAQDAAKADASPAVPRLANGKPDFGGVWQRPYVPDMTRSSGGGRGGRGGPGAAQGGAQGTPDQKGAEIPYTPEYALIFKNYDPAKFDYTGRCLPQGLTRSMNSPFPIRIVQTPDIFTILYEAWNVFEIVHTDGRQHPKDPDPTWFGDHVGFWDGDTLVVDTIAFNDKTNLDTVGHPHSDALHTIERFTRTD
jgi:hypothetical protein